MSTENSSAVNLLGARVLYVEPNDVSGSINGVPLTPDYSDYCISVNLIAEVYPRHRQSGIDGDVERKGDITATAVQFNVDENGKIVQNGKWVSFLRGDDAKKYTKKIDDDTNFLTTYYTDIDYQDLLKRNEVEGVGIESVNIAFESYYTPSITIKFIDVRGASLFGVEENRHNSVAGANSEVSKDIADNGSVFSAFFTIPYPKFRLQVKGYYGKAVTYQMTCKDFRASFNSQTGNFEATAQFLGYSYSLLTDIPMQFLIAAPYCEYAGRSYWNEHLNSPEWSMSDDTPPVRLKELFDDIRSAMENNEVNPGDIGAEFADKKNSLDEEKTVLGTIREDLDKLKSLFIYFNGGRNNVFKDRGCRVLAMSGEDTNNDKDVQFLVFTDKNDSAEESDTFEIEIKTLGDLCHTISSNCQSVPNVSCEGTTINDVKEDGKIAFKKICTIVRDGDGKITELAFVDGWDKNFGLNAKSIQKLREIADDENLLPEYSDELGEYIFVFSMGDVEEQVKNELSSCDSELIDINEKIEYKTNEYYTKVFNFRPCIGDVFKVVMCHLETFIHMMWVCYREISGMMSQRTPQSLGVDISNTDISGAENQIYPWPGIFKHGGVSQQGGEEDSSVDVWEWMGNVAKEPDKYPEIKLVKNLFCSLRDVEKDNTMFNKTNILEAFPILPSDINNDNGIFDNCSDLQDTSSLAGYIGLRCAQVIGILAKSRTLSAEDCETYGIMDALNLYSKIGQTNIETLVKKTNCGESGYLAKLFKDIVQCNSSADSQGTGENQRHLFEVTPIVNGRQPIFNKDNKYIYFFTKGQKIGLVPDHFVAWKGFNVDFHKGQDEQRRGYFNPFSNDMEKDEYGNVILKNLLVNCTTGKLIEACGSEQSKTAILNPNMFDVVTDSAIVNTVMNRYEELISSGTVSVNDNEFTIRKESIENCLYGGNEIYAVYFRDRSPFLSKSLDKKQKEEIDKIKSGIFSNYDKWWNSKNTGKLIYPDGENDGEVDGATVRMLWWKNDLHGVGTSYTNCLFADPFYYLQNEIKDEDVKRYVKAYLFLQCFNYKTESSVFNDDYFDFVTGINVVPFGLVLKLGAEYWRERYYRSNSKDPINYGDGKVYTREIKRVASDFYSRLDECIKNRLILEFKRFADTVFPEICSNLELTTGVAAPFEFTYDTFSKFLTEFKGDRFVLDRNSVIDNYIYGGCKGFYELYDNISFDARTTGFNEVRILINQGKKNLISAIKDIYCRKVLVNMIFRDNSNYYDGTVTADEGLYTSYLKGFEQTVNTLASKQPVPVSNEGFTNNIDMDSDTLLSIYMYVKNLWDRWLVTTPNKGTEITYDHYYDVKNFFSNFVFIDSFYKNIYSKFLINCETMYNSYLGRANESSIYQFIGDILQQHKCMFLALPDYIALGDVENGVKAMEDMFKPVPYNSMSNVEADNKFVVIYLPRCSEVPTSNNGYRQDNYNFYDPSKRVENGIPNSNCTADSMPVTYKTSPINDGDNEATRYGYYVPSFGVAFSRQNNQIFKNISLDMSTPLITSAAAAALTRISQSVANNDRKLTLMGQDVYPVFSNYSYQCEVEMMGNAQIQPLMYFQLMNIPMWNGVYMIFNVTHSIMPGNFTTKFKGMKLSKNALPYNKSWFRLNNNQSDLHGGGDGGSTSITNLDYTYESLNTNYQRVSSTDKNYFTDERNRKCDENRITNADKRIESLYNRLFEEILLLPENQEGVKWNIGISSAWRPVGEASPGSQHLRGEAMDLQIIHAKDFETATKDERWVGSTGEGKTPSIEYYKVVSMLIGMHLDEISEIIFEPYGDKNWFFRNQNRTRQPKCLHVGYKTENYKRDSMCYISNPSYHRIEFTKSQVAWFKDFSDIAGTYYWRLGYDRFHRLFTNFKKFSKDELNEMFSGKRISNSTSSSTEYTGKIGCNAAQKELAMKLINYFFECGLNGAAASGIASIAFCESGLTPSKGNSLGDGGSGLIQWSKGRKITVLKLIDIIAKNERDAGVIIKGLSFDRQIEMIYKELNSIQFNEIWKCLKTNITDDEGGAGNAAVKLYCDYTGLPDNTSDLCSNARIQEVDIAYKKVNKNADISAFSAKRRAYGQYFYKLWKSKH